MFFTIIQELLLIILVLFLYQRYMGTCTRAEGRDKSRPYMDLAAAGHGESVKSKRSFRRGIIGKEIFRMFVLSRSRWKIGTMFAIVLVLGFTISSAVFASRVSSTLLQVSSDPYTNSASQHSTEVEPDSYSNGSTIVAATQVGRFAMAAPPISGGQPRLIAVRRGKAAFSPVPLHLQHLQVPMIG